MVGTDDRGAGETPKSKNWLNSADKQNEYDKQIIRRYFNSYDYFDVH